MSCEYVVKRAAAAMPQSTTQTLFTVSGGRVLILGVVAHVTASIGASAATVDLAVEGASAGIQVASYGAQPAGTYLGGGGDSAASGVRPLFYDGPCVAVEGSVVTWTCTVSRTGEAEFLLWYRPLDAGAHVEAA